MATTFVREFAAAAGRFGGFSDTTPYVARSCELATRTARSERENRRGGEYSCRPQKGLVNEALLHPHFATLARGSADLVVQGLFHLRHGISLHGLKPFGNRVRFEVAVLRRNAKFRHCCAQIRQFGVNLSIEFQVTANRIVRETPAPNLQ
jgi:hypothetical protein